MSLRHLCCGLLVAASAIGIGWTQTLVPTPLSPMPRAHNNAGVLAAGNNVYVWSGYSGESRTGAIDVHDSTAKTWSSGTSSPSGWERNGMGEFVLDGNLYYVGGEGPSSGAFSSRVFRYVVPSDTWEECAGLPHNAWDIMCAVADGRAFAFGGRHGYGATYPETHEFLGCESGWAARAPMPYSVRQAGVAVYNGRIYVLGGDHQTGDPYHEYVRHVQVYDPVADSWDFYPDAIPWQLIAGVKAVAYTDRIYVYAPRIWNGSDWVDNHAVYVYSPESNTWFDVDFLQPFASTYWQSEPALINNFVYAISDDPSEPGVMRIPLRRPAVLGDMNDDLTVDNFDINWFVWLLTM